MIFDDDINKFLVTYMPVPCIDNKVLCRHNNVEPLLLSHLELYK
jgi:hypothetical protein